MVRLIYYYLYQIYTKFSKKNTFKDTQKHIQAKYSKKNVSGQPKTIKKKQHMSWNTHKLL